MLLNFPLDQFVIFNINKDLFIFSNTFFFFFVIYLSIFFCLRLFSFRDFLFLEKNIYFILIEYYFFFFIDIFFRTVSILNQRYLIIYLYYVLTVTIFNVLGLIPFFFSFTAQLYITLALSMSYFISIHLIEIKNIKQKFFCLFLPKNTPFNVIFFFVFIEILSYISRVFSLAIRLFANIMSGHTLLHILCSFLFILINKFSIYIYINFFFLILFFSILLMECGIALLQIYTFATLMGIYLLDISYAPLH